MEQELFFKDFEESDITLQTQIMKRAFDEDSRRHLNEESGGPEGYDNGDFLRKWALHPASMAFNVVFKGEIIGLINLWIRPDRVNMLGCMYIDTAYQDKGLGKRVWDLVEKSYPDTKIWRTETPGFSKRNHNFYVNKCGFHVVRIDNPGDLREESYQLEKVMEK